METARDKTTATNSELIALITDKRYRSRKWVGFLLITLGTFVLTFLGKDLSAWIQWVSIGYPTFAAANAILKWRGVEA